MRHLGVAIFAVVLFAVRTTEAKALDLEVPKIFKEGNFYTLPPAPNDGNNSLIQPKNGTLIQPKDNPLIQPKEHIEIKQAATPAPACKSCGTINLAAGRIVGGVATQANAYPWQVALVPSGSINVFCGGTVYNNLYILTTAYCAQTILYTVGPTDALLGAYDLYYPTSAQQTISVAQVIINPNYSSTTLDSDIALLKLASPANLSNIVKPACLPNPAANYDNINATVTGWGTTSYGGYLSNILLEAQVPTMPNSQCQQSYSTTITSNMICAGLPAGGKDTCQSDTGGPLVTNVNGTWVQVGIAANNYGCGLAGYPGVYTRVAPFLSWLASNAVGGSNTLCPLSNTTSTVASSTTTTRPTSTTTTTRPTSTTTTTRPTSTTTTTRPTSTTTTTRPTSTTTTTRPTSTTTTTKPTSTTTTTKPTSTTTKTTVAPGCKCGVVNVARIVGGVPTGINQYPWQVGLISATNGILSPFCGGSIISNQWILTASHCVNGQTPSTIKVVVGDYDWNITTETNVTQTISVSQIIKNPNYNSTTQDNDLALIKLSTPITFPANNKITPICLPPAGNLYSNVNATVTGWGTLTSGSSTQPHQLYQVSIPTMTNAQCQTYYGTTSITGNMMCAGLAAGGKDSCQGDSGGPLITPAANATTPYMEQIGVVSWGNGCALPNYPGVYTRVNNYLSWITSNINGSTTCPHP